MAEKCAFWNEYDSIAGHICYCELAAFNRPVNPNFLSAIGCSPEKRVECMKSMEYAVGKGVIPEELAPPVTTTAAPEDPQYQLIKDIHSSGLRCQRIIKNLLTFSRQDEFTFEDVNINEVIDSSLALVAYQIEKSSIELKVDKDNKIPILSGSANSLEQIIVNLLLNAKDAVESKLRDRENGEKGKVIISTRMHPDGKLAIVDVADNGSGIEEEHIPQIFNPFYTTKKMGKGTGLGLSVSLGIAQAHGGFIDLETRLGEGSTFSLIIPTTRSDSENA